MQDFLQADARGGLTVVVGADSATQLQQQQRRTQKREKQAESKRRQLQQEIEKLESCSGIHVLLGPGSATAADQELEASLQKALLAFGAFDSVLLYNKGAYASRPFA